MTKKLLQSAKKYIPGGVNSPVRSFNAVDADPIFIEKAKGAYIYDNEENQYIDYVGSWGPMILGHAHPEVVKVVQATANHGLSFGAPTQLETKMANTLCTLIPSIEKVRMVNSGTEAAMSAIRLARGFTKRDKIVKFIGCYHGHVDALLVKAGSGALTLGVPSSLGIPLPHAQDTIALNYNDAEQVKRVFAEIGEQIAAIIVEPIAGNMNCVPSNALFLQTLRQLCTEYQSVLIFDEVMTGFRVALGGAQSLYQITPDLTILGKIIGGGMPVGAFGGKADIMDHIAPDGAIYQAGTLSGNPIAMSAGLCTLNLICETDFFARLKNTTQTLVNGLQKKADVANIPFTTHAVGGMFGLFFNGTKPITTFEQVMASDQNRFKNFFKGMLKNRIYLAPSSFEAGFVSIAHSDEDIQKTIAIAGEVMQKLVD